MRPARDATLNWHFARAWICEGRAIVTQFVQGMLAAEEGEAQHGPRFLLPTHTLTAVSVRSLMPKRRGTGDDRSLRCRLLPEDWSGAADDHFLFSWVSFAYIIAECSCPLLLPDLCSCFLIFRGSRFLATSPMRDSRCCSCNYSGNVLKFISRAP